MATQTMAQLADKLSHELGQTQGRYRRLLRDIDSLLADAQDATDFEPPRMNAIRQDLASARLKILQELTHA